MMSPTFGGGTMAPLSVYMGSDMYLTVIPYKFSGAANPFIMYLDNVHMPYNYDLPNYYIFAL
jgi:hypothetical protein